MPASSSVMRPTAPSISSRVVRARSEASVPAWVRVGGVADELDGLVGLALDAGDQLAGVGGRLGGALGELADLVGDDGEALPRSPARAASIAAFSASRLVWRAMSWIASTMPPTCSERPASAVIAVAASSMRVRASLSDAVAPIAASMPVRLSSVAPAAAPDGLLDRVAALDGDVGLARGALGDARGALGELVDRLAGLGQRRFMAAHMSCTSKVEAPKVWSVSCIVLRTAPNRSEMSRPGPASPIERRLTPIDANVS